MANTTRKISPCEEQLQSMGFGDLYPEYFKTVQVVQDDEIGAMILNLGFERFIELKSRIDRVWSVLFEKKGHPLEFSNCKKV